MHPFRAMSDGFSQERQTQRAESQLTLGKLTTLLKLLNPDRFIIGLGFPMSYRGYYGDLAFNETLTMELITDLLTRIQNDCMGKVFEGYKGGEYVMGENTPIWTATYGCLGKKIIGLDSSQEPIKPILKEDD